MVLINTFGTSSSVRERILNQYNPLVSKINDIDFSISNTISNQSQDCYLLTTNTNCSCLRDQCSIPCGIQVEHMSSLKKRFLTVFCNNPALIFILLFSSRESSFLCFSFLRLSFLLIKEKQLKQTIYLPNIVVAITTTDIQKKVYYLLVYYLSIQRHYYMRT